MIPLVGAGGAPSAHVSLHVLMTWFQTGIPSLVVDAVLVGAALGYVAGVQAIGRRRVADGAASRRRWPAGRVACWLAGLGVVFVAVGSGLAAYDDLDPSAHVVQHVLLMMAAPPLLLLGRPVTVCTQALPRRAQVRLVRVLGSRAARVLTGPVAWPLYYGSMAVFFLTPVYAWSVRTAPFHDFTHGWFLTVGCLFWAGVVGTDLPAGRRRTPTGRIGALLAGMPVESAIAVALLFWPWPLAPGETVAAAHHAGLVLWVGAMVTSGLGMAMVLAQWTFADSRSVQRREDVLAAAGGGQIGQFVVRADGSAVPTAGLGAAGHGPRRTVPPVTGPVIGP